MADGLIIKGNILEQPVIEATEQSVFSLKNSFVALSILVHVLIALLLLFIAKKQQPILTEINIKPPTKAIKSYLYKIPSKPKKIDPIIVSKTPLAEESVTVENTKLPAKIKTIPLEQLIEKPSQKKLASHGQINTKSMIIQKENNLVTSNSPKVFSSYQQLNNLRQSIKNKIIADDVAKRLQFRSPSVMHGAQIPVPHSNRQFTPEQIREKNTTKMSDSISITKNDNGTCIIEREQFLGSPVEASTSFFSCGESKFDKSFQEHMKKVQEKIAPKK